MTPAMPGVFLCAGSEHGDGSGSTPEKRRFSAWDACGAIWGHPFGVVGNQELPRVALCSLRSRRFTLG